jgi:uncharacterized membrane protein
MRPAAPRPRRPPMGAALLLLLAACFEVDHLADATCEPGNEDLSYESFGQPFLGAYCQSCHAGAQQDRDGAPSHVTFDTRAEVMEWADRIYARSAAGNTSMPPGPDGPTADERHLLAQWLACDLRGP